MKTRVYRDRVLGGWGRKRRIEGRPPCGGGRQRRCGGVVNGFERLCELLSGAREAYESRPPWILTINNAHAHAHYEWASGINHSIKLPAGFCPKKPPLLSQSEHNEQMLDSRQIYRSVVFPSFCLNFVKSKHFQNNLKTFFFNQILHEYRNHDSHAEV